jgi:hypothetical protein
MLYDSLHQVAQDLQPLSSDYQIAAECVPDEFIIKPIEIFNKLSLMNVRKSPSPDELPN